MPNAALICATLATELEKRDFPVLCQSAVRLMPLLSNPQNSMRDVSALICQDQAFAARILKVANSAYYRWSAEQIVSIESAVLRIGYLPLRHLVITVDLADLVQNRMPVGVSLHRILAKAVLAAHQAKALGEAVGIPALEELYTSALVQSLGELAVAIYLPDVAQNIAGLITRGTHAYCEAHIKVTGLKPHALTMWVARAYKLPDDLILSPPCWETSARWTAKERRQAIVHFANDYATNLFAPESPKVSAEFSDLVTRMSIAFDLSTDALEELMRGAYPKAVDFGVYMDLQPSVFALDTPSRPGDRTEYIRLSTALVGSGSGA